jgi:regulator of sigma E protease
MNVVLGFIIICITVSAYYPLIATTKVAKIEENTSFAEKLMVGDEIIAVNNLKVYSMNDVTYEFVRDLDGKVDAIVKRDGKKIEIKDIELRKVANEKGKETIALDFKVYGKEKTLLSVLGNAGKQTVSTARMVWLSLFDLIRGRYSVSELSGPVGVTTVIGEAASKGFENLLSILSFITINVGVFNLIPFPALDGGRVLFLLVELIIRRPLNRKYEGIINFVGLALLMLLILFVTYNDIVKLFVG